MFFISIPGHGHCHGEICHVLDDDKIVVVMTSPNISKSFIFDYLCLLIFYSIQSSILLILWINKENVNSLLLLSRRLLG